MYSLLLNCETSHRHRSVLDAFVNKPNLLIFFLQCNAVEERQVMIVRWYGKSADRTQFFVANQPVMVFLKKRIFNIFIELDCPREWLGIFIKINLAQVVNDIPAAHNENVLSAKI